MFCSPYCKDLSFLRVLHGCLTTNPWANGGRSRLGWSEVTKPGSSSSLIRSSVHSSSSPILSPHFPNMSFHYVSLTSTISFSRGVGPHEPGGRYVPKLSGHQTWQWRLPVHMEVLKGPSKKWRLSIDSFDDLRAFSNIFSQSSGYDVVMIWSWNWREHLQDPRRIPDVWRKNGQNDWISVPSSQV